MRAWSSLLIVALVLSAWHIASEYPLPTPGILAPDEPVQTALDAGAPKPWKQAEFTLTPVARYDIRARLLHREPYWLDYQAKISPMDFALGWGPMSNPKYYNPLHIGQGLRWYTWSWVGEEPVDADKISLESANTHIVPADAATRRDLDALRAGDVVHLSGYLINIDGPNGWHWQSSLTRTDTGSGACELMWVRSAEKIGR